MKRVGIIALHLSYWAIYGMLLLLFVLSMWLQTHHVMHRSFWVMAGYWPGWILLILPEVMSFYLFYLLLFGRFLKTKRLPMLVVSGIGVTVLSSALALVVSGFFYGFHYGPVPGWDLLMEIAILSIICTVHGVLGLVIKGFLSWYSEIHLKERLRRKNSEMELELIKTQLSPHFLFNTLNNIDVLIQKDAGQASNYLNQLSDILRFMLYETGSGPIPVYQELQFIDKYIQLQKIRTAHPEHIHYAVEGELRHWLVEPLLFIPFIENAFKHAEKKTADAIRVLFTFTEDTLVFVCENKYKTPVSTGGLGNSLIRRRLSLLYPDRHQLDIKTDENIYKATLILNYAN